MREIFNKAMYYKNYTLENIKADKSERIIEGFASVFGNIDQGNDIIHKGAFTKTLQERMPKKKIKFLFNHDIHNPLGVLESAEETEHGLFVKNRIDAIPEGDRILEQVKSGTINEMSIGFNIPKGKQEFIEDENGEMIRHIKETVLFENSAVTFAMNDKTSITAVKELGIDEENIDALIEMLKNDSIEPEQKHALQAIIKKLKKSFEPESGTHNEPSEDATLKEALQLAEYIKHIRG